MATTSANDNSNTFTFADAQSLLLFVNNREAELLTPVIVYICFLMTVGLIGNGLVIYIYKFRFRRSSARTFIVCLALLDTMTCLVGMPYHIYDMLHPYMFYNAGVCKMLSFSVSLSLLSSTFVLGLISIDRYRKICHPFGRQISDLGTRTACALAVVIGAICATPMIFLYGNHTLKIANTNVTGVECFTSDFYTDSDFPLAFTAFLFLVFITCTIEFSVVYTLVGIRIWKKGSFTGDESTGSFHSSSFNKERAHFKLTRTDSPVTTASDVVSLSPSEDSKVKVKLSFKKGKDEVGNVTTQYSMDAEDSVFHTNIVKNGNNYAGSRTPSPKSKVKKQKEKKKEKRSIRDRLRLNTMSISDDESSEDRRMWTRHKLFAREASVMSNTSQSRKLNRKYKRSIRITSMLFTITVVFVVSFLPHLIVVVLDATDDKFWSEASSGQNLFYNFMLRTYFINNMANPIIYGFLDSRFRIEIVILFKQILRCCRPSEGKFKLGVK